MRKQLNKNTNTSSLKYNEKYCKIKNNLNDEYKSYVYKLISLLVSICVIMIIALLILIIKKNVILSYILLTIIPILAFYTLDKITIKHKEKKEAYVIELNKLDTKIKNNIQIINLTPTKATSDLLTIELYDGNSIRVPL